MNRKQLIILIVLVVVVGGIGLALFNGQKKSWAASSQKMGQKLFANLPVNDVTHIAIKQSSGELNLVKKDDLWRVKERGDYPANFSEISSFLLKAADLKVAQNEEIGASQFARLQLLDPSKGADSGTSLELKDDSGKAIQSALLGKKHVRKSTQPSPYGDVSFPDGRYILLPNNSKEVFLISDPLNDIEAKPENWLSKDFFKVEKVKSITFASTNAEHSWKLSRTNETGAWILADPKPDETLDVDKVSGVANSLSSPGFVDVVVNAKPDETGLDKPSVATLETFDGFTYTLNIGKNSGENYYITMKVAANLPKERVASSEEKPEDKEKLDKEFSENHKRLEEKLKNEKAFEKWTYLVAKWTIDPLLRDRAQLMVEKKPETNASAKTDLDPLGLEN